MIARPGRFARLTSALALASLGWLVTVPACAAPFTALWAFGDSLTDTGRDPAPDPLFHYEGRWSNGALWIEYLSPMLGFPYEPTNNYAESGAQSSDTYAQVTHAVPAGDLDHTLFVVWAGGNDFLQEYDRLLFDNAAWDAQIHSSVNSLSNAVASLFSRGARFILVPNTVDVTRTPVVNAYLEGQAFAELLRAYFRGKVEQLNSELAAALAALDSQFPAHTLYRLDAFSEMNLILDDAGLFGFTESRVDVLSDPNLPDKRFDGPGDRYVFWDSIHPTTRSHALIADWFLAVVAPQRPRLQISSIATGVRLDLSGLHSGKTYILETATNLPAWSTLTQFTHYPEIDASLTPTSTGNPRAFYRIRWSPP